MDDWAPGTARFERAAPWEPWAKWATIPVMVLDGFLSLYAVSHRHELTYPAALKTLIVLLAVPLLLEGLSLLFNYRDAAYKAAGPPEQWKNLPLRSPSGNRVFGMYAVVCAICVAGLGISA